MRVYVASKAAHGPEWVAKREAGYPVMSTWIDESAPGATSDWPDLWERCVREAASADALVVIRRGDEVLKGAWAEVGAALASGVPVFGVGCGDFSIRHHRLFTECATEDEAFERALRA